MVNKKTISAILKALDIIIRGAEIEQIQEMKQSAVKIQDFKLAAELRIKELELISERPAIKEAKAIRAEIAELLK